MNQLSLAVQHFSSAMVSRRQLLVLVAVIVASSGPAASATKQGAITHGIQTEMKGVMQSAVEAVQVEEAKIVNNSGTFKSLKATTQSILNSEIISGVADLNYYRRSASAANMQYTVCTV